MRQSAEILLRAPRLPATLLEFALMTTASGPFNQMYGSAVAGCHAVDDECPRGYNNRDGQPASGEVGRIDDDHPEDRFSHMHVAQHTYDYKGLDG